MWALHESFDPSSKVLTLELLAEGMAPETPPGAPAPALLGTFSDLEDARLFVDGYLKSVAYAPERVVRRVSCGGDRRASCREAGAPCTLGLDDYRCPWGGDA